MGRKKKYAYGRVVVSISVDYSIYKEIKDKGLSPSQIFMIGWERLKKNERNVVFLDELEDNFMWMIKAVKERGREFSLTEFLQEFERHSYIAKKVPISEIDFLEYLESKYKVKIVKNGGRRYE